MLVVAAWNASTSAESLSPVAGTRLGIQLPDGFEKAERFAGFALASAGASILVNELPGSFLETSKGFTKESLARRGMRVRTEEELRFGEFPGLLFSIEQQAQGRTYHKWIGLFGDTNTTFLVTATWPSEASEDMSATLKGAVASARVIGSAGRPEEALTFTVQPAGDFKIAKVLGNTMILTRHGEFPVKEPGQPVYLVGASASRGLPIPDRRAFAVDRFQKIVAISEVTAGEPKGISIDGLDGLQIVGSGTEQRSNVRMAVHQVMLFDEDGYYLLQGMAAEDCRDEYLAVFSKIAESFRRRGSTSR